MAITTTTVGFIIPAAGALGAIVLAWARRRPTGSRSVRWSASPARPGSRRLTDWFAGDPVLFIGPGPADGSVAGAEGSAG